MKTIKIAIWINILFYVVNLCFSAWLFIVVALNFSEISDHVKFFFLFFLLLNSLPVLSIIGLLRRRNWGRMLTIFTNLFLAIGYLASRIISAMGELHITQVLIAHDVLIAYFVAGPLIALDVILLTRKAKSYFKAPKA